MDTRFNTELCKELLKKAMVQNENIADCHLTYFHDNNNSVDLGIATEKDEYGFVLSFETDDGDGRHRIFLPQEDKVYLNIEDVRISGYNKITPEEFGVLHLKCILKSLARHHSCSISKGLKEVPRLDIRRNRYKTLLQFTENNNSISKMPSFRKGIEDILDHSESILKTDNLKLYVQSYIFKNDLLLFKTIDNETVDCKIVRTTSNKYLPLVYDMLLSLYSFSTQKLRQHHIHELLLYYYKKLEEHCNKSKVDLPNILPREEYYSKVKLFLPLVKLEMSRYYCNKLKSGEKNYEDLALSTIFELYECILYPNLTREDCYNILENKNVPQEALLINWNIFPREETGNYLNLNIRVKLSNEDNTMTLLTRLSPEIDRLNYKKEELFYSMFLNQINNLGLEHITDFCPKCYLSRTNEILVLQDMKSTNYKPFEVDGPLPYQYLRQLLKQLAKFHASSLLYEEIMTEKTGKRIRLNYQYKEHFHEPIIVCDSDEAKTQNKIKEKNDNAFCVSYKNLSTYRYVICHGNLTKENILFNKILGECCLTNFGTVRYCPPTFDLPFMLCMNTNKELRKKYAADLVDEYYNDLSATFKEYGFDLNKIYTNKQMFECLASTICQTLLTQKLFNLTCDPNILEAIEEIFAVCINECSLRYN